MPSLASSAPSAPRRRAVLALLCLASFLAEVAAGLAIAAFVLPTGAAALDVLAAAGAVALLALADVAVRRRRREPTVIRTLPVRRVS